jgi:quercetin dioxygenase-like cupin family protein
METTSLVTRAGERAVWWTDGRVDVKLSTPECGMWLWEARRGAAAPLHLHRNEDEQFLVLDGRARFVVGDETLEAGPGDLVFLPRGVPHAYLIVSETARVLGSATPGGFEGYFTDLGTPLAEPEAPPSLEAMTEVAPRYGIELVGPPPAL